MKTKSGRDIVGYVLRAGKVRGSGLYHLASNSSGYADGQRAEDAFRFSANSIESAKSFCYKNVFGKVSTTLRVVPLVRKCPAKGCHCPTYVCAGCKMVCCWANGAADDMPEHCDDCWNKSNICDGTLHTMNNRERLRTLEDAVLRTRAILGARHGEHVADVAKRVVDGLKADADRMRAMMLKAIELLKEPA